MCACLFPAAQATATLGRRPRLRGPAGTSSATPVTRPAAPANPRLLIATARAAASPALAADRTSAAGPAREGPAAGAVQFNGVASGSSLLVGPVLGSVALAAGHWSLRGTRRGAPAGSAHVPGASAAGSGPGRRPGGCAEPGRVQAAGETGAVRREEAGRAAARAAAARAAR